jgi:hypothetical protein
MWHRQPCLCFGKVQRLMLLTRTGVAQTLLSVLSQDSGLILLAQEVLEAGGGAGAAGATGAEGVGGDVAVSILMSPFTVVMRSS